MLNEGTNQATYLATTTASGDVRPPAQNWGLLLLTVFGAMLVYLLGNDSSFL